MVIWCYFKDVDAIAQFVIYVVDINTHAIMKTGKYVLSFNVSFPIKCFCSTGFRSCAFKRCIYVFKRCIIPVKHL